MNRRGQSTLEYAIFLVAFIAAILVMAAYLKRGIQGNWYRNTAESFPEYYDPAKTQEKSPLQIKISNYTLAIAEAGKGNYTANKTASWIPMENGKPWTILKRP